MTAPDGTVRPHCRPVADCLALTPPARVTHTRDEAERAFHRIGNSFAVAGADTGTESMNPRIIAGDE